MTVQELRQSAKELRDKADCVLYYNKQDSLDEIWSELRELFGQGKKILSNGVKDLTLDETSKSLETIRERADFLISICDLLEPPVGGAIPGDYGT